VVRTRIDGTNADLTSHAIDPRDLESMSVQRELLGAWCELLGASAPDANTLAVDLDGCSAQVVPSIEHVMTAARTEPGVPNVLVVGSLHLVGGFMAHLQAQGMLDERLVSTLST